MSIIRELVNYKKIAQKVQKQWANNTTPWECIKRRNNKQCEDCIKYKQIIKEHIK